MDFNNKNSGKRKAQSIQDMINASPAGVSGIRKSGYAGPKVAPKSTLKSNISNTMDFSGINVTSSDSYDRWGNSNQGMPQPKKERYKSDVANPMRGNILKKENNAKAAGMRNPDDIKTKPAKPANLSKYAKSANTAKSSYQSKNTRTSKNQPVHRLNMTSSYVAPSYPSSLDDYGWIIFSALLAVCIIMTLIVSGLKPRSASINYDPGVISVSGIINSVYEKRTMGYSMSGFNVTPSAGGINQVGDYNVSGQDGVSTITTPSNTKEVQTLNENDLNSLGDDAQPARLDDGSGSIPGVKAASSHEELVAQLKEALSSGNYVMASSKLCYVDDNTNEPSGYPMSVVKLFSDYMAANPDKLSDFISDISDSEYSTIYGSAYLIKLPVMKFTVIMGASTDTFVLDNTIVSVSGFSDQIVNGNQNAAIYPLLPCMYSVTLTNNAWPTPSKTQEIEATLGEGNLEIKVGTQ